jgi:hypothetical protein
MITSSAETDASSIAICLEACTTTKAANLIAGALFKVLVK